MLPIPVLSSRAASSRDPGVSSLGTGSMRADPRTSRIPRARLQVVQPSAARFRGVRNTVDALAGQRSAGGSTSPRISPIASQRPFGKRNGQPHESLSICRIAGLERERAGQSAGIHGLRQSGLYTNGSIAAQSRKDCIALRELSTACQQAFVRTSTKSPSAGTEAPSPPVR